MQSLADYCRPFKGAENSWPPLPFKPTAQECWWRQWIEHTAPETLWPELRCLLPQLWFKPDETVHNSASYRRLVLQGESADEAVIAAAPMLQDPEGISLQMMDHPCGAMPVLRFRHQSDFVLAVRCLAHRCKPATIQTTVHAQAIAGLIHWGLIRDLDRDQRCELLLLHEAPYSSLPAAAVPGNLSDQEWLEASMTWRLEHELTHIACKRLVGEMRINLFDELLADALGMRAALGQFNATLFLKGLGVRSDGSIESEGRAHVYLQTLNPEHHTDACKMVCKRAQELEALWDQQAVPPEPMTLLRMLTQNRLDQPLTPARL